MHPRNLTAAAPRRYEGAPVIAVQFRNMRCGPLKTVLAIVATSPMRSEL